MNTVLFSRARLLSMLAAGVLAVGVTGCAAQRDTAPQGQDTGPGSSRMAPTQTNQGSGNNPSANQATPDQTATPQPAGDDADLLPRMGPTQNTQGTGENPDALDQ